MHPVCAIIGGVPVSLYLCGATMYLAERPTSTLDLTSPSGRIIHELKPASVVLCVAFAVTLFGAATAFTLHNFNKSPQPQPAGVADSSLLEEGHLGSTPESEAKPARHETLAEKILLLYAMVSIGGVAGWCAFQSFKKGVVWPQTGRIQDDVVAGVIYALRGVVNCSVVLRIGYGLYLGAKHTIGVVRAVRHPEIAETELTLREGVK